MRIVLIAHNLRVAGGLSVGRNIISTMPQIAPMHEYLMVVPAGLGYSVFENVPNIRVVEIHPMPVANRLHFDFQQLPAMVNSFRPDWVWALGNHAMRKPICKQSLLFQNAHRVYPGLQLSYSFGTRLHRAFSDWLLPRQLRYVNRVYCQTETMRKRFAQHLGFSIERISVCPNAVSAHVFKSEVWPIELEDCRDRFVMLVLTKYYQHKNLERIVECFIRFKTELQNVVCVMPVTANQGKHAAALVRTIRSCGLQQQLRCVDSIPQHRLGEFFHAARVMFLPTLLESFSGTYLEAMQFGVPILTSDLDFAHEICGDAASYIDPYSIESIKDGVLRLKDDAEYGAELVRRGHARYQQIFKSWPEILRSILDQEGIKHS